MRNSWFVSILMLLLAGCVSIRPQHIARDKSQVMVRASRVAAYVPPETSHLFKATLDIRKHHLTGLLMIKKMGDCPGTYRIVFMNEIGMTFFDLELKPDSLRVVSCFASLNKKALLKIIETDFRVLTCPGSLTDEHPYRQEGTGNLVVSGKSGKYKIWNTWSPAGDTLYSTAVKSTIADPANIRFDKYSDGFPVKISIENPFIGMKISLRKLAK